MIDKQLFDETFQYFDAEMTIGLIDDFKIQQSEIIQVLALHIQAADLIQVKLLAHKLKGPCSQFYDANSAEDARKLEEAASHAIGEVVYEILQDHPGALQQVQEKFTLGDLVYQVIFKEKSIDKFIEGVTGSLSPSVINKIRDLERSKAACGFKELLNKLDVSSAALVGELLEMKKDLLRQV